MSEKILKKDCPFCFPEKITAWLKKYFGTYWKIMLCSSCKVPMVVYRYHTLDPPEKKRKAMIRALKAAAREFFGDDNFYIDEEPKKIKDHYHAHARRK